MCCIFYFFDIIIIICLEGIWSVDKVYKRGIKSVINGYLKVISFSVEVNWIIIMLDFCFIDFLLM